MNIKELNYDLSSKFGHRAYELHKGDVLYCNVAFIKEMGYSSQLELGQHLNNGLKVVKEIRKENKKRWWQFWIKKYGEITGYHLEFTGN